MFEMEHTHEVTIARGLGVRNLRWWDKISYGGGASCATIMHAAAAIATGLAEVVVCHRARNRGSKASRPWAQEPRIAFLCPVPGYDRHFTICNDFGIEMIQVPLTDHGPDMAVVESLVASDARIKGMWCVPKYSNPTGEVYSDAVSERLAKMKTAAPDFRIMWDNAYGVHHISDRRHAIADIMALCEKHGNPDRAFVFASTSKMTYAGAGVAMIASSPANVKWLLQQMERRTIGADKLNQLRHVRFLKNEAGIEALMAKHASSLRPKFDEVQSIFERLLGGKGVATWTKPDGGYFISFDVMDGCAKRVIQLGKEAGITVVPPGATFPYGKDPNDRNIRVAPSFPSLDEVTKAAEGLALATLVAASEALLAKRAESVTANA